MLDVAPSDALLPSNASPSEATADHCAVHQACHSHDQSSHGESTAECCPPERCSGEPKVDGGGQPCPTPQVWHQVLASFREQADAWTVTRDGRTVRGRSIGAGPPIYFLNGLGGTHELFVLTAWLLRDEYRCVLFDSPAPTLRGPVPADSPWPACVPPVFRELSADLLAAADHLGDATFSSYATSFGTPVALSALAAAPDRMERVVLQGGFARLSLSAFERLLIRLGRWAPGRVRHLPMRSVVQRQSHLPWFPPFDGTRWQFFADDTGSVPIRTIASRAADLSACDLRSTLPDVRTPVLLIRGEGEGRVSAAAADELAAGLPNAVTERMHGCGHLPYLTHPHRLVKLVRPFFKGDPLPSL